MIKKIIFILNCCLVSGLMAQSPIGKIYKTSDCASGGFDYFFLPTQEVVAICQGCEDVPYRMYGKWQAVGKNIVMTFSKSIRGRGVGKVVMAASVNVYAKYKLGVYATSERDSIPLSTFDGNPSDDCTSVGTHAHQTADLLWHQRSFEGKYPFTATRFLQVEELKKMSINDLQIMRNEIYARHGYIFKIEKWKKYFSKIKGYTPQLEEVTILLNDYEVKNAALIQSLEKK